MSSPVVSLANLAELEALKSSLPPKAVIVLYFHADWAKPCQTMATGIEALATDYARRTSEPSQSHAVPVVFGRVLAEEAADISTEFEVSSVPYTFLFRAGDGKGQANGVSGGNIASVRNALEELAGPVGLDSTSTKTTTTETTTTTGTLAGTQADPTIPPVQSVKPVEPLSANSASGEKEEKQSEESLFKQLEALVKASSVMLFLKGTPSEPRCGFSRQIVALLREKNIRYGFFNILANEEVRNGLKKFADWPTYPQLWVQGELVGGLDIVREEFEASAEFMAEYRVPVAST